MKNDSATYIPFAWYCAWLGDSAEPVWEQYEECHPATKQWDNFPDKIIPLYTHPAKNLSLQKVDGELVAVTYTDDEHRIIEVLWEKPSAKTLTDEEIDELAEYHGIDSLYETGRLDFARAILRKAQEK